MGDTTSLADALASALHAVDPVAGRCLERAELDVA
jgi:hypothetical protein